MARSLSGKNLVVQGVEQGSVFPTNRVEAARDVLIDGRAEEFDIRGGVYSHNLSVVGSGTIRGPVLSGADLRMEVREPGLQRLLGGVAAHQSVVAKPMGIKPLGESPAATTDGIRFVVRGDIQAERVVLQNTLVVGSISSPEVRLENSIVLGAIVCRDSPGQLHAIASSFGLFDVKRLIIEGPTTLSIAAGATDEAPEFRPLAVGALTGQEGASGNGKEVESLPPRMRLLSLCRLEETGCGIPNEAIHNLPEDTPNPERFGGVPGISCEYWLYGVCPYARSVSLYPSDFVQLAVEVGEDSVRVLDGERPRSDAQLRKRWFFGVHSRAVNAERLKETDHAFQELLHMIFSFEHLDEESRELLEARLKSRSVSVQETILFRRAIEGLDTRY